MESPPGSMPMVLFLALIVALISSEPAPAQSPEVAAPRAASSPTLLGAGVWSRPAYLGSDERVMSPIPVIRYYGRPWFARTTQGMLEAGARVVFANSLSLGAQLTYEAGRDSKDSDFLTSRGFATMPIGASLGVHAAWDTQLGPAPVTMLVRLRQEVGSDRGAQIDLRSTVGIHSGARLRLGLFGQATWADSESNQSYFGVSASQAAISGLPQFDGERGLVFGASGLLWSYDLSARWMAQGLVESRQLSSALRESPLTQARGNTYASVGVAFRR
jgi:outer membrane protein